MADKRFYPQQVVHLITDTLAPLAPFSSALDFGCGDGWYASQMLEHGVCTELTALEVKRREHCYVEPELYDGTHFPYAPDSFDLVYAIDVLHHCTDPLVSLASLLKCTKRYLLLKDHTYSTCIGWSALYALDLIGNTMQGIASPARYQKNWMWADFIESQGFKRVKLLHPAPCHRMLLGKLTNNLQFVGLWEKSG